MPCPVDPGRRPWRFAPRVQRCVGNLYSHNYTSKSMTKSRGWHRTLGGYFGLFKNCVRPGDSTQHTIFCACHPERSEGSILPVEIAGGRVDPSPAAQDD